MNFFQLIFAFIKKNFKNLQETNDSNERKKQWIQIIFGSLIATGSGLIHLPPNVPFFLSLNCQLQGLYLLSEEVIQLYGIQFGQGLL